jgi:hypothetical protein
MANRSHQERTVKLWLGVIVVAKGIIMATIAVAVISDHGLSSFDQALIIAIASATITGIFTLCAAIVAVRSTRPAREEVHETHTMVIEAAEQANGKDQ